MSMHVTQRRKCQSDLVITPTVMKRSDEHAKPLLGLRIQKFFWLLHPLVVVEKRGTGYENWVNHFILTKKNKKSWEDRERTVLELSFPFSVVVLTRACTQVSTSELRNQCEARFQSSPKNGSLKFRLSSHRHGWCSTIIFVSSYLAANWLFFCFLCHALS